MRKYLQKRRLTLLFKVAVVASPPPHFMKTVIRCLILLIFVAETTVAFCEAGNRPSQAMLTTSLRLPVVSAGVNKGFVDAPKGTTVWVLHVRHKMLYIDFSGAETWIKRSATDYDQRLAAF